MPVHTFQHEASGETIDVYVPASAPTAEHSTQIKDGKVYKRVYSVPRAAIDTKISEGSREDFHRLTNKAGITNGEMFDLAKELSEHRASKAGRDNVKESFYRKYEKEFGEKHAEEKRRDTLEQARKFGISLE